MRVVPDITVAAPVPMFDATLHFPQVGKMLTMHPKCGAAGLDTAKHLTVVQCRMDRRTVVHHLTVAGPGIEVKF